MAMLVRELMTPDPVVIGPDASVATVRALMRQHHIHHLPLVEGGTFSGVIDATQAFGWVPHDATARDLRARTTVQASPDEPLFGMLGRCAWSPVDVCVVTHPESKAVIGIVTERDLVRLAAERLESSRPVDEVASTTLVTAPRSTTVGEGLDQLREHMFRHLVVVDDDRLAGTASLRDMLLADVRGDLGSLLPSEPSSAAWGESLRDVAVRMRDADLDAMAIADDGRAEGLVTVTDLVRALRNTSSVVA